MAWATATATAIMGRHKGQANFVSLHRSGHICVGIFLVTGASPSASAKLLDFQIQPSLSVSQTYSDNFRVQSSAQSTQNSGGFVTDLAPTLNMSRDSSRSHFSLNARLQYLYYEGVGIDPRLFPQLQMTSKTEIFDNSVYIDSTSTISQGNLGGIGGVTPTNAVLSNAVNDTTYRTFRISPYWLPHFGGYADGEIRFGYYSFSNSNSGSNTTTTANGVGNFSADSFQESVYLRSGRKFDSSGLSWRLSLSNQDQKTTASNVASTLGNVRFTSTNGEISYRLIDDVSTFVQLGYYDNSYPGNVKPNNGLYITPGLSWTPSPNFSLAAGYGLNAYFSNLVWRPSNRTTFSLNYRNSQVGGSNCGNQISGIGGGGNSLSGAACPAASGAALGGASASASTQQGLGYATGALGAANAGSSWNGSLHHQTRSTFWTATYSTVTTTIQQALVNQPTFTTPTDLSGNAIGDATANNTAVGLGNSNNVFVSKRFQITATWQLPIHQFMLSGYQNDISYLSAAGHDQNTLGVNATWNWRLTPRMNLSTHGLWQSADFQGAGSSSSDFLSASVTLTRQFSSFSSGSIIYSHFQTLSGNTNNVNSFFGVGGLDSNSVTARFTVNF
ncbi:MAG: TIGR03016 family PEP-CTERM system-associated outer membrane protein [Candidatus Methylumidiphilus sp.]